MNLTVWTRTELKRTGSDVNNANIGRVLDELVAAWKVLERYLSEASTS